VKLERGALIVLAVLGIPSVVAGAYLTGTSGEVHILLITGICATMLLSLVLWEESETNSGGADDDTDEDGFE